MSKKLFRQIGSIVVDSGQIQIGDPCTSQDDIDESVFKEAMEKGFSQTTNGVLIVSTAFGDGIYPIYLESHKDGTPLGLVIPLITEIGMQINEIAKKVIRNQNNRT